MNNNILTVLVISPDPVISNFLAQNLPAVRFEIVNCRPGSKIIDEAFRANIAIIDRIHERTEAASREITLLKKNDPALPVITVSEHSSGRDASVVNQGVFYYLAGYSEKKLLRIVYAAAESLEHGDEDRKNKRIDRNR